MTATFDHPAVFYRDDQEYVAEVGGFVTDALADDRPVLVAAPEHRLELLRTHLGDAAADVVWADMAQAGRNPGRIIATVLRPFVDAHGGRRPAVVGEPIWPGRTTDECVEAARHEALINEAFQGRDASILCPYDAANLDADTLTTAETTHPQLLAAGVRHDLDRYSEQEPCALSGSLPDLPEPTDVLDIRPGALSGLRRFVVAHGSAAGLDEERVDDLRLAVNELATNTVKHGGGTGTLRVWRMPETLVCEIRDGGYIRDQLAGRRPPADDQIGGRGLLLVHQLCDLVQVRSDADGTTVRLHVRTPALSAASR